MPTYASEPDVRAILGKLGSRLPADVDPATHLDMAHASITDRLRDVYGTGPDDVPDFAGDGLEVVRWAEAKLAAASVMSTLLLSLPAADREAVTMLRAEAYGDLSRGIPGYPVGGVDPDGAGPASSYPPGPSVSSGVSGSSLFPDPYDPTIGPDRVVTPWPGYVYGS